MKNKFEYVLDTFGTVFDLSQIRHQISYGVSDGSRVQIRQSSGDFFQEHEPLNPDRLIWKDWSGTKIPFLFETQDAEILCTSNGGTVINFDVVAASFFFLSGWQEYTCREKDRFGRFPFTQSIQHKTGMVAIPVVNYYFDILKTAIEQTFATRLERKLWPQADFATCISHDIDKCQSGWREGSLAEIRRGNILAPARLLSNRLFSNDAWFNFSDIIALEKSLGIPATFYFLSRKGKHGGVANADYDIATSELHQVLKEVQTAGSEVALHASYGTHLDRARFLEDRDRLAEPSVGSRFHFLAYDTAQTPLLLEQAGVLYDSTLGFSEHYGFRNGYCFPFRLYDIANDRPTLVLEIPLNLMDTSLHHHWYMNLTPEEVVPAVRKLVGEIKKFGGCFTLLWHNTHFSRYKYRGWRQVFVDIVKLAQGEGSAFFCGRDLLRDCAS